MFPYQQKVYNLSFLLKSQYWDKDKLDKLRLEGFKAVVNFASKYCPYYRGLPKVGSISDTKNFPILTKSDVRKNFDDILVDTIPHEIEETGGTVSRVRIARDKMLIQQLSLKRFESWYGYPRPWTTAHLWGSVEGKKFVENRNFLWMPVELLDSEMMAEKYLQALDKMKPDLFHAYALPLATLAHYANKLDIHPHCKIIRSECETLTDKMREEIESAFVSEHGLFNLYGSRDLGGMAQDCGEHNNLHYFAERYIIEEVDGRFLFTDMLNYAFPLIRYENQDIGELADEPCSCDITLPMMKPVIGRVLQYIKTKSGNWTTAFIFYLPINYYDVHHNTKIFSWIESFVIKQRKAGEITLLLKPWDDAEPPIDFTEMYRVLDRYIKKEDFNYNIEVVDKLPLSRSGKQISVDTTLLREWD